MEYRTLEHTPPGEVHRAFLTAFSDYQVPMELTLPQFQTMLAREGFSPDLSAGAFQDGELVGFVLAGAREWGGRATLYDLGTAVVPAWRGRQVTTSLLALVRARCAALGVDQFLLEVLRENTAALTLYQKQGFRVVRTLDCWRDGRADPPWSASAVELLYADALSPDDWATVQGFWDYPPSWQNSIDSVRAAPDSFSCALAMEDGAVVGYGVMGRNSGSIVQLAVARSHRRRGLGTALLCALAARSPSGSLRAANVDSRNSSARAFLERFGFTLYVSQYEMIQEFP